MSKEHGSTVTSAFLVVAVVSFGMEQWNGLIGILRTPSPLGGELGVNWG